MHRYLKLSLTLTISLSLFLFIGCSNQADQTTKTNPLRDYVQKMDPTFKYELYKIIEGDGYKTHILRMVSGQWLTTNEVKNPEWWHWVHLVVPDEIKSTTGFLLITGGERKDNEPEDANELIRTLAIKTGTIAMSLHNIPNQPTTFVGDPNNPRYEDAIIAYGWRKFLEEGAGEKSLEWLPRLPMTRAAVRAMDSATDYAKTLNISVDKFVVAGGSKRGWTTWTTAIADDRVVAIAPIVIDMLNLTPSFLHHWDAYGFWAPAVDDYVNEGIMDWFGSVEFGKLQEAVEPYSFKQQLTLPKMLINASGDQFFLPDSWQFYWNDLVGEKNIRYVPNTGHSLDGTDAFETLLAFYSSIVTDTPRPKFDWKVKNGRIHINTEPEFRPVAINIWQNVNEKARDFRVEEIGKWTSSPVALNDAGEYILSVETPSKGWRAFFGELVFEGPDKIPFKITTGVTVVPESLPFSDYKSATPKGTKIK